jgi:hypothetical protein
MEKTYNYKAAKVQTKIIRALKKSGRESTIADIISSTALPAVQVEEQISVISSKYAGHVKVTESGEMLYFFPNGFRQKKLKKFISRAGKAVSKALILMFKIWTAVMLVGYAVLFTLLLLAAIFASFAASSSDRGRSRGGSGFLASRIIGLIIRIWFWRSLTRPYGYSSRSYSARSSRKPPGKPLYQIVFSFLFGDREDIPDWQKAEELELIRLIQRKKGIITVEEVMARTGRTYQDAEQLLHSFCVRYNGEPKASENGSVYYEYRDLLKTSKKTSEYQSLPDNMPMKVFSKNKSNAAVIGVNLFNLAFSSYFIFYTQFAGPEALRDNFSLLFRYAVRFTREPLGASTIPVISAVLGIIPFVYSVCFFLLPALRNSALKRENKRRALRNYRRKLYDYVLENPRNVQESFLPAPQNKLGSGWEQERQNILGSIGDAADISVSENNGIYSYDYPEIERKKRDIAELRKNAKTEDLGNVIFSSDQ